MRHGAAQLGLGGEDVAGGLAVLLRPEAGDVVATNSVNNHCTENRLRTLAKAQACSKTVRGYATPAPGCSHAGVCDREGNSGHWRATQAEVPQ